MANELDVISVSSPCHVSWQGMTGDDQVRFCERCRLNVYNLSAMTREAATNLVREREGRLCVRFYRRRDGTVVTRECTPKGLFRRVAAAIFAILSLTGCSYETHQGAPLPPPVAGPAPPTVVDNGVPAEGQSVDDESPQ